MFVENGMNHTGWQACFLYNTLNWNFAVFKHQLVNFVNIFCSGLWNWASWTRLIIQVFPPPFEFRNPWCNSWIWRRRLSIDIWQAFVDIGCVFAFQEEKSYDCSILDSVHFEEIADFSKLTGPPIDTLEISKSWRCAWLIKKGVPTSLYHEVHSSVTVYMSFQTLIEGPSYVFISANTWRAYYKNI